MQLQQAPGPWTPSRSVQVPRLQADAPITLQRASAAPLRPQLPLLRLHAPMEEIEPQAAHRPGSPVLAPAPPASVSAACSPMRRLSPIKTGRRPASAGPRALIAPLPIKSIPRYASVPSPGGWSCPQAPGVRGHHVLPTTATADADLLQPVHASSHTDACLASGTHTGMPASGQCADTGLWGQVCSVQPPQVLRQPEACWHVAAGHCKHDQPF